MHLPIVLHGLKQTIETTTLIDSGATGNFMDPHLLPKGIFKLTCTPTSITAYNMDGTPNTQQSNGLPPSHSLWELSLTQ